MMRLKHVPSPIILLAEEIACCHLSLIKTGSEQTQARLWIDHWPPIGYNEDARWSHRSNGRGERVFADQASNTLSTATTLAR